MEMDVNQAFLDACAQSSVKKVKLLLEQGVDVNVIRTHDYTP
jgi:hypothetical protein